AVVRGIEGETVMAECQGAMVRGLCSSPPACGQSIVLSTRPERMRFTDGTSDGLSNRLSVTVSEAVFAGERCRYLLRTADGTSIVLKEPSSATIRRRSVGELAEVAWSVADTILV